MTVTTHTPQTRRDAHDRAEFQPTDTTEVRVPSPRQAVEDAVERGSVLGVRFDEHGRMSQVALTADPRRRVRALHRLTGATVAVPAPGGIDDVLALDVDLDLWIDIDGAEHAGVNPTASVMAAAFGVHGEVFGSVTPHPAWGRGRDVGRAARSAPHGAPESATAQRSSPRQLHLYRAHVPRGHRPCRLAIEVGVCGRDRLKVSSLDVAGFAWFAVTIAKA